MKPDDIVIGAAKQREIDARAVDRGIPEDCCREAEVPLRELNMSVVCGILSPKPKTGHKGDYGRLLMAVGSERYRGAAVLAAMGACYTGAGLITVASDEKALAAVAARVPEAILLDTDRLGEEYTARLTSSDACLIGCGLTVSEQTRGLFVKTIVFADCPLVIDADGINIIAEDSSVIKSAKRDIIITPHVGEFSRLTGISTEKISKSKDRYASEYADENNITVVLKSENTVVALPGGQVFVNTIGNSGLAKAGSGDLLSGMIAALLAMGKSACDAALAGVYLHSLAADIAAETRDAYSLTASYVAEFISEAYRRVFSKSAGTVEKQRKRGGS